MTHKQKIGLQPSSENAMNAYRDTGPYSARNSSKGALIEEAGRTIEGLRSGLSLGDMRRRAVDGGLFTQRARSTRERVWGAIHYLYLSQPQWGLSDLLSAYERGPLSREFVSLLYVHYVLRDRLTYDFVTGILWNRWHNRQLPVSPKDLLSLLDQASETQPQIERWADSTRIRLVRHILAALRDFGVLEGIRNKKLVRPVLPLCTGEHLLRILMAEGLRGTEVLRDPTWRIFFLSEHDVAHILSQLAQERRIHFERVGDTVVLQALDEWSISR